MAELGLDRPGSHLEDHPRGKILTVGAESLYQCHCSLHRVEIRILSGDRQWEKKGDWPSTPEGEAYQAQEAARIYTLLFSHPAVEAITWWDFSDRQAWQHAPAGLLRSDMTPKPAYDELKKLLD